MIQYLEGALKPTGGKIYFPWWKNGNWFTKRLSDAAVELTSA